MEIILNLLQQNIFDNCLSKDNVHVNNVLFLN